MENISFLRALLLSLIGVEFQFSSAWMFQSPSWSAPSAPTPERQSPPPASSSPTSISLTMERRQALTTGLASFFLIPVLALPSPGCSAETVGKDPNCDDRTCLGVWDGLLADCPHSSSYNGLLLGGGAGCTSSQDDTPGIFSEPWDYSEAPNNSLDYQLQMRLMRPTVELVCGKHGDSCQVLLQEDRYLRMLIEDGKTGEKSVAEFYFTPNDTTVQFRIASLVASSTNLSGLLRTTSLRNIDRGEMIRKELRYLKIPVLRNRKRSLFFVESDLDRFGPGSAPLGPPAEMRNGEIDGRLSDDVDPKLKIDFIQQFPFSTGK